MNTRINGMVYLLKGFHLLRQPKIRPFVLIPLLINIVIFSLLLGVSIYGFDHLTAWLLGKLPDWLQWLSYLLWVLFVISFFLILVFTFTLIANLIAAPFNGFLAEQVEHLQLGEPGLPPTTWADVLKDTPRVILRELRKIAYYLPRALALLICFLIPGINLIAGFLWLLFNAWMMNIQYLDYPMDNHKISFAEMLRRLRQHRLLGFSFGGSVLLLSMIPVVNFLVMPAAVAGATCLWVEHHRQGQSTIP